MSYNISSGDLASAYKKSIFGPTWNDSRANQLCSVKVTAYGDTPLTFTISTKFVEGTADNAYQYRMLARSVTINPGDIYELDAIMVFYNQQVIVKQISGNGIAYIYATPFIPRADKLVQAVGTTTYNTGAGGVGLYYMQATSGTYGIFDIMIGNFSGSPTVSIACGSTTTTPTTADFIVRNATVPLDKPYIFRKATMASAKYLIVQVSNGVCDISMLGFGLK